MLLSEAVLDFTLRIVAYSNFNHSFLTKAMLDTIDSGGELETLLLTQARARANYGKTTTPVPIGSDSPRGPSAGYPPSRTPTGPRS